MDVLHRHQEPPVVRKRLRNDTGTGGLHQEITPRLQHGVNPREVGHWIFHVLDHEELAFTFAEAARFRDDPAH